LLYERSDTIFNVGLLLKTACAPLDGVAKMELKTVCAPLDGVAKTQSNAQKNT